MLGIIGSNEFWLVYCSNIVYITDFLAVLNVVPNKHNVCKHIPWCNNQNTYILKQFSKSSCNLLYSNTQIIHWVDGSFL